MAQKTIKKNIKNIFKTKLKKIQHTNGFVEGGPDKIRSAMAAGQIQEREEQEEPQVPPHL